MSRDPDERAGGADETHGDRQPPVAEGSEPTDETAIADQSAADDPGADTAGTEPSPEAVEAHLEDALERVAHGAVVSVPSILGERALLLTFTAVLTNGFAAAAFGLFALARRFHSFVVSLAGGFGGGLSRYLPPADSDAERDLVATFASVLILGCSTAFGVALFVAAPAVARLTGEGPQFQLFVRIFAVGVPATAWLFTAMGLLRAFEEVTALNLAIRVGYPVAQLAVAVVGVVVLDDLALVAVGVVGVTALVGIVSVAWLARKRGLRPRLRGPDAGAIRRKYLRFTVPLFFAGIATTTQRLGFYPLIAWFLSGTAAGVFAVGVLVSGLVRLPLMGINQFISPVAAALHAEDHRRSLSRLYHVTSRLVLVGVTGLAVPVVVYRRAVMGVFGETFVAYAALLPGFVLAQYLACAAGSVGILLTMTDHQRALLVVNVAVTAVLIVVAVPMTATYGLPGLVASYLLMLALNNGAEVAVLYYLHGLQPFTAAHAKPLVAAVPLALVALAVRDPLAVPAAPLVGTALGLAAYAVVLQSLGFAPVERRLVGTLVDRYREVLSRA